MNSIFKLCMAATISILLSACVADRIDKGPLISEKIAVPYEGGAIFKAGFNERPLFEERRARNIGDALIMNVADTALTAKKTISTEKGKLAEDGYESDAPRSRGYGVEGDEIDLSDITSEALVGPVNMTVIDVLDNGNLLVTGGRQVSVNEDEHYLRVTGVVNPMYITNGNTVQSTQMSQVHVQIDHVRVRGDGTISRVNEGNSVFGNYFHSVSPR